MATANGTRTRKAAPAPVLIKASGKKPERVHLFTIETADGVQHEFHGKNRVPYGTALKMMEVNRTQGGLAAETYALHALLGDADFSRLCALEDLDPADFAQVSREAAKIVFGKAAGKA